MDQEQSSGAQIGNFDMGECFCEVKCRLFNIGRAHCVAFDKCRTCVWVASIDAGVGRSDGIEDHGRSSIDPDGHLSVGFRDSYGQELRFGEMF